MTNDDHSHTNNQNVVGANTGTVFHTVEKIEDLRIDGRDGIQVNSKSDTNINMNNDITINLRLPENPDAVAAAIQELFAQIKLNDTANITLNTPHALIDKAKR